MKWQEMCASPVPLNDYPAAGIKKLPLVWRVTTLITAHLHTFLEAYTTPTIGGINGQNYIYQYNNDLKRTF